MYAMIVTTTTTIIIIVITTTTTTTTTITTIILGSPSNLLCDVNWLRPRAGAPGDAL